MSRPRPARTWIATPASSRPRLALVTAGEEVTTPGETCAEMIGDLEREIEAARSTAQTKGMPIVEAVLARRTPPYHEYRVTLAEVPPPIRSDDVVLLVLGRDEPPIPAHVVGGSGRSVRLSVVEPLPPNLPTGTRLVLDSSWLLERLRDRLRAVRAALLAHEPLEGFDPSLAQLAVGRGDFDHNAIENGSPVDPEQLEKILAPLNEGQRQAVERALARRVLYVWGPAGTGKTTTLAALIRAHVLAGRRVLVTTPSNAAADVIAAAATRQLADIPGYNRGLLLRLGPRPGDALVRRHGSQILPHLISERLCAEAYGERRTALEASRRAAEQALKTTTPGSRAERGARRRLDVTETELRALAGVEAAFLTRCADELLDTCRVAIAPVHHIYLSHQIRGDWDVVVVEEASMVTGPQLYLAAGRSQAQVVVAGDFVQLPPPVAHHRPAEVRWLVEDPFERLGIPQDIEREDDPPYMVMLTEQYRMAPTIAEVVSTLFYSDRIRTAPETARRAVPKWSAHPEAGSLVLIDTTGAGARAYVPSGTQSRANPVHAMIAAEVVRTLCDDSSNAGSVIALSPYTAQALLLRDALAPVRRGHRGIRASTVHRAQGDEADTVLLSLDDAPGARTSRFMAASQWTDVGARLINVGLSRAKGRLIVLAPVEHLLRTGGPVVRNLLELLLERATLIGWEQPSR